MTTTKHPRLFYWLYVTTILLGFLFVPAVAKAARTDLGVWIPYWSAEAGTQSAQKNIDEIDIIYPFVFEVDSNGTLRNRVDFADKHWEDLFAEADDERVAVIPTIAWFDGPAIHATLSDQRAHK